MPIEEILWTKDGGPAGAASGVFTLEIYTVNDQGDGCESFEAAECSDRLLQALEWSLDPDGHTIEIRQCGIQLWHKDRPGASDFTFSFSVAYRGLCPVVSSESSELSELSESSEDEVGAPCTNFLPCHYHPVSFTVDPDGHLILVTECGEEIWNVNRSGVFVFDFDHNLQGRSEEVESSEEESCPPPGLTKILAKRIRMQFDPDGHCEWISRTLIEDCACFIEELCTDPNGHPLPRRLIAVSNWPDRVGTFELNFMEQTPADCLPGPGWYGSVTFDCVLGSESVEPGCTEHVLVTFELAIACSRTTLCGWLNAWKCSGGIGWVCCSDPPCPPNPHEPLPQCPDGPPPGPCPPFELLWCGGQPHLQLPCLFFCCAFSFPEIPPPVCPELPPFPPCITIMLPPPGG